MARLHIDRKITVWSREFIEFDETKYTEEEFVKLYHQQMNGVVTEEVQESLYESYDYDILQHTSEDIDPKDDGNQPTLYIQTEGGETLYTNLENQ